LLPTIRDVSQEWDELALATVDEKDDWLEPAFVQRPDGVHFGIDYIRADDGREHTWLSRQTLPDPHNEHTYVLTIDASTGDLSFQIDGAAFEGARLESAPFHFAAPPVGHPVLAGRKSVALRSLSLRGSPDGPPILDISAADTARWVPAGGIATQAPPTARFVRGPEPYHARTPRIPADQSFTWAIRARFWPDRDPTPTPPYWMAGTDGMLRGEDGWALGGGMAGLGFGFVLAHDGVTTTVDAGSIPPDAVTVLVELDRRAGELRLRVAGAVVARSPLGSVGSIDVADDMSVLGGYAGVEWMATFPRILSGAQIAELAAS
jgi:hypothetical protein